ncbi:MAG: DUF1501 domain-containing protein [Planctomycetota bacterium]|nr:DUF1501 domain-containing protein [Planctomycetota bacterium]
MTPMPFLLNRRSFVSRAIAGLGVLSLPNLLRLRAEAAQAPGAKKRSLILLWQDGGASHFETFDPKPDAPSEYRGELGAIPTALPGIAYCEVLPRLAALADRTCVIRSLHQPSSDHVIGSQNVLTGWYGETEGSKSRYPDLASVISRMRSGEEAAEILIGASTDPRLARGMRKTGASAGASAGGDGHRALPGYIDIASGLHRGGPAFLGPLHAAFQVAGDPAKPGFVIQNLQSIGSANRFHERLHVLSQFDRLDQHASGTVAAFEQFRAVDGFRQQAVELLSGGAAARAFDLSRERPEVRQRYGLHLSGQQCLLARRLVEAGVDVVAVRFSPDGRGDYDKTMIGWDDHAVHGNIFAIMKKRGPQFDQAVSSLIEDLEQRGMRDEVLLVVAGEFGRTPRIHVHKGCPGREHWGPAGCALVYGGGLTMGQIVGSTNDKGEQPHDRPVSYQDLLATIYHSMGIDPNHTLLNQSGRPVPILSTGTPITELTGSQPAPVRSAPDGRGSLREPTLDRGAIHDLVLPAGATNADLAAHADLSRLRSIVAHDSAIDDLGLVHLAGCRGLRRLELNGAPITDAGLPRLADLTELEELNLTGTQITNAGLSHLKPLSRLKRFAFNGATVSLPAVIRLIVRDQGRTLTEALAAMGLARFNPRGEIASIDVANTPFGDEEMQYVDQLPALRELHLAGTQITDAGMAHVARLSQLEELYLAKTSVGDAGLAHVAGLARLRAINLYGTQITTAGLEHLMGLAELRMLMITDVKLNPAAVENLKAKLPGVTVTDFTPV